MKSASSRTTVPLSDVLEPTSRPIRLLPQDEYKCLGVQWYAKGVFVKEAKRGSEIAAKILFAVEPGEFIYNRLFAWKGSFALTTAEHVGCVVSGEFPTFRIREDRLLPRYLQMFCSNQWLWDQVGHVSSGTSETSRSRLKEADLLRLKMPLPALSEQRRVVNLLDQAENLRTLRQQTDRRTADLIPALFHNMVGDPSSNLNNFRKDQLGKLIRVSSGKMLKSKEMCDDGKYAVYGGNGISGYHSEFMFEHRMIVIGRVGAYCGAVHLTQPKSWVTDNALYVTKLVDDLDDEYLANALRFLNLNQYAGRAAQPLVSGNRIYPVSILVPPALLQKQFATAVADIRAMQDQQAASRKRLDDLFHSLLHRAFRGEL